MRSLAFAIVAASAIFMSGAATAAPITPVAPPASDSIVTQVRHGGWHRGGGWRHRGWYRPGWNGRRWRRGWYGPGWGFYGGGVVVGRSCGVVRRNCAWRGGWGGPNYRRCVWRRGC
mgnify:CR=1 FL=1